MKSADEILNQAVATANTMGISCSGWMIQGSEEGIVAWLYVTDEDGRMLSLMGEVESFPDLMQAAQWCLAVVKAHGEE